MVDILEIRKKRRELATFCAWHVKQHINKYFAPFYPQALLLSFKEVEKKKTCNFTQNGFGPPATVRHISER